MGCDNWVNEKIALDAKEKEAEKVVVKAVVKATKSSGSKAVPGVKKDK